MTLNITVKNNVERSAKLGRQIADALREAIIAGALNPGDRITEEQVAAEFGVSRTPTRDAIHSLEQDGLITATPSGATIITRLSLPDLLDITGVRLVIEPYAARLAAEHPSGEATEKLQRLYQQMLLAAKDGNRDGYLKLNEGFHATVYEASGSACLTKLMRAMNFALYFREIAKLFPPNHLTEMWQEHDHLLQAITNGDADMAEQECRQHIERTMHLIKQNAESEA